MGEFLAIACAAIWALAVILFKRSGETLPAFELNLFKNLVGVLLLVPTALLFEGAAWPAFSTREWALVLLSGVIGIAVADTWYLRALNLIGAARTGVAASLYSPFVVLLSIALLGEVLAARQWLGFALVIAGIVLVNWRDRRIEVSLRALRLGLFHAIGGVLMMAVGIVMVVPLLAGEHFFTIAALRLTAGSTAMLVFLGATGTTGQALARFRQPQPWPTVILASVLGSYVAMLAWLGGYRLAPAAVASVLNETASAFIVLFAWLMLGEPVSARRGVGVLVTFSGVALMVV
ncbi:MAG: DMT family transporter [Wenzhouxiangellaceae bacterium]|nr:DMT family transporter [Wenzhouxiangellaceae bacterium]